MTTGAPVVVLAGGTGGAKLARGLLDIAGADLVVIANTGDDVEVHGAHVSPDPDLVTYWLADRIDERGWGLRGDTFAVMDALAELGDDDVWFRLGDRDLAVGLRRARRLREGATLTQALAELAQALGVPARVLPMSDDPVRTRIFARGRWHDFQEFMIKGRGEGPVDGVDFARDRGRAAAGRGARGHRGRAGDRDRPVQPGDLHPARSSRRLGSPPRCGRPPRRWSRCRRSWAAGW